MHESGRMAAVITPRAPIALPQWLDAPQGRSFVLSDDRLEIVGDPAHPPLRAGALVVGVLTWARES